MTFLTLVMNRSFQNVHRSVNQNVNRFPRCFGTARDSQSRFVKHEVHSRSEVIDQFGITDVALYHFDLATGLGRH